MSRSTLTLKQRLAALSLSTTSPSAYDTHEDNSDSASSSFRATIRKKAPWLRRQAEEPAGPPTPGEMEKVQQVLARMIFQAGVDYEVVLNASALPDPATVSYDLLLSRILAYLDLYVEADYTVVFFASGNKHTPGWNWVWKAYRSLSRKYRKNLKQLYIVHSSWFSKMLFSLAGAIISAKFFSKIVYVSTLSELAYYVPLTQIDIPAEVYRENLKYEDRITLPTPIRSNVFGVPLEDIMGYEGEKGGLPRVVRDCIAYLHQHGLLEEGIFRRSPSSALLRAAQDAYDRGNVVSLDTFSDPHLAAVLLKKFLRDLPEPIFPESLYPVISACPPITQDPNDMNAVMYLRETLLPSLAPCAVIVLSHILQLMHDVAQRADVNKMGEYNLAVVLTPNLVKGSNPLRDVAMCAVAGAPSHLGPSSHAHPPHGGQGQTRGTTLGTIIALCIRRYYEIFDELHDPSEPIPSSSLDTSLSSSLRIGAEPSFLSSQLSQMSPLSTPSEASYVIHDPTDDDLDDDEMDMPMSAGWERREHRRGNSSAAAAAGFQQQQSQGQQQGAAGFPPPSAWSPTAAGAAGGKRHRTTPSAGTGHTVTAPDSPSQNRTAGTTGATQTHGRTKSRSLVSVEKGSGHRKGTISIGRSATRKGSGAAVEARGVTVMGEGFFSPSPP